MTDTTTIECLDKGYVRLVQHVGSDLTVTNAARASYEKESEEYDEKDDRLVRFLLREDHLSPFRHSFLTFEVRAPLMVARQHWKYAVASNFGEFSTGWNEGSRRYVTSEPIFYMPNEDEWRAAPENSKQGSGDPVSTGIGGNFTRFLEDYVEKGEELYQRAMDSGICAEQARLFLPAYGLYVSYYWSASLQTVLHFLKQRLAHDAQSEIRVFAEAVRDLAEPLFPNTFKHYFEYA